MPKGNGATLQLPEDIFVRDILPCLPVRSLFRFRCVSKQICALIDSPDFIKYHLINYNSNIRAKTNQLNLLIHGGGLYSSSFLDGQSQTFDDDEFSLLILQADPKSPLQFQLPLKDKYGIYGSVNGLLCLPKIQGINNRNNIIIILNPATKRYHQLPVPPAFSPRPHRDTFYQRLFGFGYDSVSNDFKFLRIERLSRKGVLGSVEHLATKSQVYSLRTNSWKIIQDLPAEYKFSCTSPSGEFVCNALHWMVSLPQNEIFSFDLVTENHKLIAKPDILKDSVCSMRVGNLGGCLSLTCNYASDRCDVWLMKDYGVKESWNKLFSISYTQELNSYMSLTPLAYSERGNEILLVKEFDGMKDLLWYNRDSRTTRNICSSFSSGYRAFICGESMFPLSTKLDEDQL